MSKIKKPSFYTEPEKTRFDRLPDQDRYDNLLFENETFPDCTGKRFSECIFGRDIIRTDMSGSIFTDVIFTHCDLSGVSFAKSEFRRVRFENCRMGGADFTECLFSDTEFTASQCRYVNFSASSWKNSVFSDTDFTEGYFSQTSFKTMVIHHCCFDRTEWLHTPMAGLDVSDSSINGIAVTPENLKGLTVNEAQALACVELLGLKIR